MKSQLWFWLLLLAPAALAPASPARAQLLLDAAAGAALQGSMQSSAGGNAVQLIKKAKGISAPATQLPLQAGQLQANLLASPSSAATPGPSTAPALAGASPGANQTLFTVNGHGIQACSSGLPCLWQMRRAMGLR